jgi:hypothetical protein
MARRDSQARLETTLVFQETHPGPRMLWNQQSPPALCDSSSVFLWGVVKISKVGTGNRRE